MEQQINTVYYSDHCPDTPAFIEGLKEYGVIFREVNITDSIPNLKAFLKIRDQDPAFDEFKAAGKVGIPVLVTVAGDLYFTLEAVYKEEWLK